LNDWEHEEDVGVILSHRIALDPTMKQRRYFAQAAGCARFVWNWALDAWNRDYGAGGKPSAMKLRKTFNTIKYQQYPWMRNIHRDCHSQPFANLQKAFVGFFKKIAKRPKFHARGRHDSFYVANDRLCLSHDGWVVHLPLIGQIRMHEQLRFKGWIMGATVSRTADRWFIAIQVEVEMTERQRTGNGIAGADWGLKSALVITREADGQTTTEAIAPPKPLKNALRKLCRMQRSVSRRTKGGSNRRNLVQKVARVHAHVASIRADFWHKIATRLCRENQAVGIENLNVAGMLKNRRLSRAIVDVGCHEFRRQMDYKSKLYGTHLFLADPWYPSSKTCSRCGTVKKVLGLGDRVFCCDQCGHVQDRDANASVNLCHAAKASLYPRLEGNSRLRRGKAVSSLAEAGTTPGCSQPLIK
jgi:putative transposase